MTITRPEVGHAPPALLPRYDRVLAIWETGVRERFSGINIALLALVFIVVLLPLGAIFYLHSALLGVSTTNLLTLFDFPYEIDAWFFFLILLATSTGASIVAGDVAARTLTLYFSRPIERSDYLVAKSSVVGFWMGLGAIVPGLVGVVIVLSLGYVSLGTALTGAAGYFTVGLLATIVFTGIAVGLSSLTSRRVIAGAGIFGVLVGIEVVAVVFAGVSGQAYFDYLSPEADLFAVSQSVFQVGGSALDAGNAAAALLLEGAAAFGLAYLRIDRSEVVAG